jgi:hypothetical protein
MPKQTQSKTNLRHRLFSKGLLVLALIVPLSLIALAISYRVRFMQSASSRTPTKPIYVSPVGVWPQLRPALNALGDRLEKPGKERILMTGTISLPHLSSTEAPMRLLTEIPDKARLEVRGGKTLIFDGADIKKLDGLPQDTDFNEIESLLMDSMDRFFIGWMQGNPLRYIGERFRIDDGSNPNYTGPYYDIYQLGELLTVNKEQSLNGGEGVRQKKYFINSDTQLLEKIRYQATRDGSPLNVEVQLSDWRKVGDQQFPGVITRLENSAPVMIVRVHSVAVGKKADDGIFSTK